MGSSGSSSFGAPGRATPSGPISQFGQSTEFTPSFRNVLPSTGWATPESVESAMAAAPVPVAPPPMAAGAGAGGAPGGLDAFAQSLIDWRRKQTMGAMSGNASRVDWRNMPQAQGAAQQLIAQGMRNDLAAQMSRAQAAKQKMYLGSAGGGRSGGHSQR